MSLFNESAKKELWSAKVELSGDRELFDQTLRQTAETTGFTFFGFFVFDEVSGQPTAYHFTRYPQAKYQTRSQEECKQVLTALQENLRQNGIQALAEVEQATGYEPHQYRIILGLREGYEQNQPIKHSLSDARKFLSDDCVVKPAEMFAVGPERNYREPAVMILGQEKHLPEIYSLAAAFKQERFILENFTEASTCVVEFTPYD